MSERSSSAVPTAPVLFYIAVIMERRPAFQGRWKADRWQALGAVASTTPSPPEQPNPVPVRQGADLQQWLWRGLPLELHRDEAESYYYNLLAERPSLYLLCRPDGDRLAPVLVTASHYVGEGYLEAGDEVCPVAMPPEVYRWVEQFVVDNYTPQVKKSRKREKWHD